MRAFRRSYHLWKTQENFSLTFSLLRLPSLSSLFLRWRMGNIYILIKKLFLLTCVFFLFPLHLEVQTRLIIKSRDLFSCHWLCVLPVDQRIWCQANVSFVSSASQLQSRLAWRKETTLSNEAIDPVITAIISRATYHIRGVEKNTWGKWE